MTTSERWIEAVCVRLDRPWPGEPLAYLVTRDALTPAGFSLFGNMVNTFPESEREEAIRFAQEFATKNNLPVRVEV